MYIHVCALYFPIRSALLLLLWPPYCQITFYSLSYSNFMGAATPRLLRAAVPIAIRLALNCASVDAGSDAMRWRRCLIYCCCLIANEMWMDTAIWRRKLKFMFVGQPEQSFKIGANLEMFPDA